MYSKLQQICLNTLIYTVFQKYFYLFLFQYSSKNWLSTASHYNPETLIIQNRQDSGVPGYLIYTLDFSALNTSFTRNIIGELLSALLPLTSIEYSLQGNKR